MFAAHNNCWPAVRPGTVVLVIFRYRLYSLGAPLVTGVLATVPVVLPIGQGQGSGAGVALTVAVTLAVAETGTPAVGGVPEAVAVLLSKPLSMLPWVMVRVPVTVSAAPGASVVGCAGVDTVMVSPVSLMKTLVRVTLPLLVATRV